MKKKSTKKIAKNFTNKIAKYGAMALAVAGVSDAMGQINYTDIDPDETIDDAAYEVDLNGDAVVDFIVTNVGGGGLAVRIYNDQSNSVLGINAGGNYNYPNALNEGDPIGPDGGFLTDPNYQTLNWNGCAYTNSQWCDGQVDKYVGLRFNVGGAQHYGFIQLDVPADASTFTIKSYGYEETADTEILAGASATGIEDISFINFEHFVSNDVLTLRAASAMEKIVVYNVNGQAVINKALTSATESIDLSAQATGLYIAEITIDGVSKSFKISK